MKKRACGFTEHRDYGSIAIKVPTRRDEILFRPFRQSFRRATHRGSFIFDVVFSNASASNEHQDKDSLNETASTTAGGNVESVPSGTPGRGERNKENESSAAQLSSSSPPSRSLVSRILARARSPKDLLDHTEPL